MAEVMTNDDVFETFAARTQTHMRNKNETLFSYDGETLYSYGRHFPLARFIEGVGGKMVALVNASKYSITTSRHQRECEAALTRAGVTILPAYRLTADGEPMGNLKAMHCRNLAALLQDCVTEIDRADRARSPHKIRWAESSAESSLECAHKYNKTFGLRFRFPQTIHGSRDEIDAARERIHGKFMEQIETYERERRERRETYIRDRQKAAQEDLEKWLKGGLIKPTMDYLPDIHLRISGDGEHVETTTGYDIRVRDALYLFDMMSHHKQRSTIGSYPHTTFRGFPLQHVDSKGNAKVGCHLIKFDEAKRIADLLDARGFAA